MFHVSFLCFNSLKIKRFKRWNIGVQCFILGFNVSFFIYHPPFPKNSVGEKQNPNGSDLKPQWERNQTPMRETPLKHWNQKWNIECQCFISWKYWLSMYCVITSDTTKIFSGSGIGWHEQQVNALNASYFAGTKGIFLFRPHSHKSFNLSMYCELQNRRVLFFNPPVVPTNLR